MEFFLPEPVFVTPFKGSVKAKLSTLPLLKCIKKKYGFEKLYLKCIVDDTDISLQQCANTSSVSQ